jgi:low temperature requirement protein LtrA
MATASVDETLGFVGVGQQLIVRQHAGGAVAIFLLTFATGERTEATKLALDRNAHRVGHLGDFAGHLNVVVVVGGGLAVALQRSVHHDAGEAVLDGALAGFGAVAVILMHHHRDAGIEFGGG